MKGFNKVILAGNLTRDPELRYTATGVAVCKLSLAVNRSWKDPQSGETREEVTFVEIDAFGKQAETLGEWMKKGKPLLVEGRLKLDTWDDKQTQQKRSRLGVTLESFTFLDSGREDAPAPTERTRTMGKANSPKEQPSAMPDEDGDVPF